MIAGRRFDLAVLAGVTALALLAAACSAGSANDASGNATGNGASTASRASATGGSTAGRELGSSAPSTPSDTGMTTRVTSPGGGLVLETSSTRADLVTGEDVLVTVSGPAASGPVTVRRNGQDVSSAFAPTPGGDARRGLVTGLTVGPNTIEATAGDQKAELAVTDHPRSGPVFSGTHQAPFVCTTERLGLGPPTDADCSAPVRTTWSYQATDKTIKALDDPSVRPADVDTTTVEGRTVPFIIRAEQGVIDRGVYWVWVLDPSPGTGQPGSTTPGPGPTPPWNTDGWNQRLVYRFGGGCGTSYSQGSLLMKGLDPDLLGRGYAVATNTLDTLQTACNGVLSAEAAAMTREHFVERYGIPRFTIGDGGSGGAIQQLFIGHAYPGLLDGLAPALPFPDYISIAGGVTDCGLLKHYYESTDTGLTDAQKQAINGHASLGTCDMWASLFLPAVDPTRGCDGAVPPEQIYNPDTNPTGIRCTLQDSNVNIAGRDPSTGFARRPLDNVGIQYGLSALTGGRIDGEQFVRLNEQIGGYDIDGRIVAARSRADDDTIATAYRAGLVTGPGPLQDVPIILRNLYTDDLGDIHTRFQAFSVRDRLKDGGRDDPNLLLWTDGAAGKNLVAALTGDSGTGNLPIVVLDEWLTARDRADPAASPAERLQAARPAGAVNRCTLPDGTVLTGGWELYDQPGPCRDAYPVHLDPRLVAGEPQRDDILKCALKPLDPADYGGALDPSQLERLRSAFPDGVCDYSRPGVGQQPQTGTWQRYR